MIIHALPENQTCCGGIKVHYDLCEIERELGIESVIAFPDKNKIPTWFKRDVGEILSYDEVKEKVPDKKKKQTLVIGWEDPEVLDKYFAGFKRACYIQGDVFWRGQQAYAGKYLICSNKYIQVKTNAYNCDIIEPFIRPEIFYPGDKLKFKTLPYKVLVQARKGGKEAVDKLIASAPENYHSGEFDFKIIEDMNEEEFATELREADIFFAHSFPEGFGLPALEAMASRTLVIGFSGGGGINFMENGNNCFYASDGDYQRLNLLFNEVLSAGQLETVLDKAYGISKKYSRENTKNQLVDFLRYINLKVR